MTTAITESTGTIDTSVESADARRPPRGDRPPRALRRHITALPSAALAVALAGCLEHGALESFAFDEPVERVVVRVDAGEIRVSGSDDVTGAAVEVELDCRTVAPEYQVRVDGGTLLVSLDADLDASACTGRFELAVPRRASLDLRTGDGEVLVANVRAGVRIATYDGGVALENVAGGLDVAAPDGDVIGVGIAGADVKVTVGAGHVRLAHAAAPERLDVSVILGGVDVVVPAGAYDVETNVVSGTVRLSGVVDRPEAPNRIRIGAERGDIMLAGYGAGDPERLDPRDARIASQTDSINTSGAPGPLPVRPAAAQPNSSSM